MNIKSKLLLTVFIASLVALAALSGVAVNRMQLISESALAIEKKALLKDYDLLIKGQVQSAVSLLAALEKRAASKEITHIEAQKLGADLVRQLRFQEEGYFWIDTVEGTNVVLLGSSSEGKNRIDLQDNHGKFLIREIIRQGRMDGGGYTDYWFPKAGGKEYLLKRGYSLEFKPWGWIVGTGNYIDDINTIMAEHRAYAQKEYAESIRFFNISSLMLILVFLGIGLKIFRLVQIDKKIIEQTEGKLQKSEARFQQLFEKSCDPYTLISDGGFIDCNRAAEVMLRGDRQQILGKTPEGLSPEYQPDGRLSSEAAAEKIAETLHAGTNHFEWLHRRLDGSEFWAEISLSLITLNEQPVIFCSWRDITERKQLEADRQQCMTEQQTILDTSWVGIAFVQNRKVKWSNTAFATICGYSPEEIKGSSTSKFYRLQEEYSRFGEEAYPVLASGEVFSTSLQMLRKDGSLFHARFIGKAINPANQFDGSIWILSDETIQKELEEKLQKSHDLLTTLSHQIPGMIYQYQEFPNGRTCFPYSSDAITELYGLRPEEVREDASSMFALVHPDDVDKLKESYRECASTLQPRVLQYRVILPGQGVRWRYSNSRPEKMDDGSILWHGFVNDITDQKNLEQELHQSNERFKQLAEVFPETIFETAVDGTITYLNNNGLAQFRYTDTDVINKLNIFSLVAPEDRECFTKEFKERIKCIDKEYIEFTAVRADGTSFDAIGVSVPIYDNCELTGLRGFCLDISYRKQTEVLLQEREQFLQNMINVIPVMVGYWDNDIRCRFINKHYSAWYNMPPEQMRGKALRELMGEYYREVEPQINAVLQGEFVQFGLEHTNREGDGRKHLWVQLTPDISNDKVMGYFSLVTDVTEIKQTQQVLEQLNNELEIKSKAAEAANRAKSEFLANMSHEIRTPMNGLLGMAQLLELTDLTEDQANYVETLRTSGKNLLSLINDILDLSKIESGNISLEKMEFDLEQSLKDVVLTQKQVVHKKGLTLGSNLSQDIPDVLLGDQLRVKQILLNLVSNAVKFTTQGGITLTTKLLEILDGTASVQIAVRDTGIGIAPDALDKIFRPFVQEDGSITRKFGGTGLGLSICRSLTELMGGSITVESTLGAGSCFMVTLPFEVGKSTRIHHESLTRPTVEWDGPPLRILLVEDDPVNSRFGKSMLHKLGHVVIPAVNGVECLSELENDEFDIVLMDIQMPIMNGEDALKEIREKEKETCKHQLVIALTAYSLRGDKERFLAMGFDGYLSKPLETTQLISELKRVAAMPGQGMRTASG